MVTGTYHTDRADVIDLQFSGLKDPLGATPSHPFWSVSRQSFIPAGELVLGEEVLALDGQTFRLTTITPRAGPEPVFNLEVANQHTYYVSSGGLLVHNAQTKRYLTQAGREGKLAPKKAAKPKNIQRANKKGGIDTESTTRNQALQRAKQINNVPRSAQPIKTYRPYPNGPKSNGLDERNVLMHEYVNQYGEKVFIRLDKPARYSKGGSQRWHFNSGQDFDKLIHHHYLGN